jgi:FkbM family methyltransferase
MPETFRHRAQKIANTLLNPAGLHLQRADRAFEMDGVLHRARRRGFVPRTVIDVGASDGIWSVRAQRIFPEAKLLLFEPLRERHAALQALRGTHGFEFVPAAAGAEAGSVAFAVDSNLDGSGVAASNGGSRSVPMVPLDTAVATRNLGGPYCVKLDTHGYEIPILSGATQVLRRTQLLIVEAYNFTLAPGALRFHELCAWLGERGFRCCDLAEPMRRPSDGVLWQIDLAFAQQNDPMFAKDSWG